MRRISKLFLAGLTLCLALPLEASGPAAPCPVVEGDQVRKTTSLEVKGVLRRVDARWEVGAGGKTYRLDFTARKVLSAAAEKLAGKAVLVGGRHEQGVEFHSVKSADGIALMSYPVSFDSIVVSRLEAVETEAVRETVTVEVTGTLDYRAGGDKLSRSKVAGREWVGYVVNVNGAAYLLRMADRGQPAELARTLKGGRVTVAGRLESWCDDAGCVGGPGYHPLIVVTDLRAVAAP